MQYIPEILGSFSTMFNTIDPVGERSGYINISAMPRIAVVKTRKKSRDSHVEHHSKSLPWGTIYAIPVDNVLCIVWQNNNMVLALSTIHSATDIIEREAASEEDLERNLQMLE